MRREKRTAHVQAYITPSLREQLELYVAQEGSVVSISDYLFEMIEDHVAMRAIRISKQRTVKRIGE